MYYSQKMKKINVPTECSQYRLNISDDECYIFNELINFIYKYTKLESVSYKEKIYAHNNTNEDMNVLVVSEDNYKFVHFNITIIDHIPIFTKNDLRDIELNDANGNKLCNFFNNYFHKETIITTENSISLVNDDMSNRGHENDYIDQDRYELQLKCEDCVELGKIFTLEDFIIACYRIKKRKYHNNSIYNLDVDNMTNGKTSLKIMFE